VSEAGRDYIVACVIATEVPPLATGTFTNAMIPLAIQAVCDVIQNRAASPGFPDDPVSVVLQPKQFSAVCREEYWRQAMAGMWFPRHVAMCLGYWQTAPAPSMDALWYYSPISMEPPGRVPSWVEGKTEVLIAGLDREYFRFYA